jgi:hypothetical protein
VAIAAMNDWAKRSGFLWCWVLGEKKEWKRKIRKELKTEGIKEAKRVC